MTIEQHVWGVTPEGEAIIIYTMRNTRGSEVQVCNIGAALVSVKFADRNGNIDEVLDALITTDQAEKLAKMEQ